MIYDSYHILIALCIITIVSYLFNIISERLKVPSVILLIGCGVLLQSVSEYYGQRIFIPRTILELLGVIGLIMIVLEGALDLKITKEKKTLITKSFIAAGAVLLITTIAIADILHIFLDIRFVKALPYAVAMGVISSSIAIPSVDKFDIDKKEFIIYESTFSDILGIMLFNYVISDSLLSLITVGTFVWNLVLITIISILSTLLLMLLFRYLKGHIKVFLILAIIILVYSLSKQLHLPSLFFILVFGLVLNNVEPFLKGKIQKFLHPEKLLSVNNELKIMTAELAFLIRTFFFLLFGYSLDLSLIFNSTVLLTGSLIILVIMAIRYVFLRYISQTNVFPELFIAPRGLITIILFYSIPPQLVSNKFNEGVLSFVIIASGIIMMIGILFYKKKVVDAALVSEV
ncbi:MAG: cation:proton antiporter [Daejeonella sp.]|uniref:cation:proton antiporter domain-containing protein n=1 Tax=Daejeonella sp. TaxID=2805397 RepID=UPI003C77FB9A